MELGWLGMRLINNKNKSSKTMMKVSVLKNLINKVKRATLMIKVTSKTKMGQAVVEVMSKI